MASNTLPQKGHAVAPIIFSSPTHGEQLNQSGPLTEEMVRAHCQCANPRCECHRTKGKVHCPAHDDASPSLSVSTRSGKALFKCWSGCEQSKVFNALLSPIVRVALSGAAAAKSSRQSKNPSFDWKNAQKFDYCDEMGNLLFQVGRIGDGEEKTIRQRRPDGKRGWRYDLTDVRRVLWLLPEVKQANVVIICEGEKAVSSLNRALESAGHYGKIIATTMSGGTGMGWREEYNASLSGKSVCVLPDNDETGHKHAQIVCASICASRVAASIKQINLPGLPSKGDFAEWGGTVDELLNLIAVGLEWEAENLPSLETDFVPNLISWPQPQSLKNPLLPVPPLDTAMVPEPFRDWIWDCAERISCPPILLSFPP
ncbi:hypothetical protein EON83_25595 [bacterium]|nr:MAG: hypothetical protein EON83_25595 [bacterium]